MGYPHPDDLLSDLTPSQFQDWVSFAAQVGGFGIARNDLHYGLICATLANIHKDKNDRAFKPETFMPYYKEPERKELTAEELDKKLKALF